MKIGFINSCLTKIRRIPCMNIIHARKHRRLDEKYMKMNNIVSDFPVCDSYLSIVCIAKNEGLYIEEWLDFYRRSGVDHIYFFDNGSTDNTRQIVKKYEKEGFTTLIDFKGECAQLVAYRWALRKLKGRSKWIAFLDADEFLFSYQGNLKAFFHEFEEFPGVGVNWIVFGPCGHDNRPEGSLIQNYRLTFTDRNNPLNLRIKSIVRPEMVADMYSPHYCIYKWGRKAVDENRKKIKANNDSSLGYACTNRNNVEFIRINHYWTKSKQDLREKCERGYPDSKKKPDYESILKRLDFPLTEDSTIIEYINNLNNLQNERG